MSASNAAMSLAGAESAAATGADAIRFVDHDIDASYGVMLPEQRTRFSSSRDAAARALSPVSRDSFTSFTAAATQRLQQQRATPDDLIHRAASKIQGLFRVFQAVQHARFLQRQAGIRSRRKRAEHHIERLRLREEMDQRMQQFEQERMRRRKVRLFVVDEVLKQQRGAVRAAAKQNQTDRRLHKAVMAFQAVLRRRARQRNAKVMEELRSRAAEVIQMAMRKWRSTVRFIGSVQMRRRVAEHRARLGREAAEEAAQRRVAARKAAEARRIQDEADAAVRAVAAAAEAARIQAEADPSFRAASIIQRSFRRRPSKMVGLVVEELRRDATMVCTTARLSRLFDELKGPDATCLTRQQWLRQTSGSGSSSIVTDSTRDLHSMQLAAAIASAAPHPASSASTTSAASSSAASASGGSNSVKPLKAIGRSKWKLARASVTNKSAGGLLSKLSGSGGRRLHRASSSMRVDSSLVSEKRKRSRISMQTSTTIFNAIDDDHSESIEQDEFVQFFKGGQLSAEMMDWVTDAIINMESPHRDQESRARSVHKRMKQAVAPACHAAWCWRMSAAAGRFFDACPGVSTAGLTSVAFAGAIKASPGRSQLSAEEAVKLFRRMDDDSSGTIDRDELTNGITEPEFESLQDWLLEHFSQGSRQEWAIVDHDAHCAPPLS
jgi:Ca2+-binding EF-hand superfamily protein